MIINNHHNHSIPDNKKGNYNHIIIIHLKGRRLSSSVQKC
jgi:hypothetical protein